MEPVKTGKIRDRTSRATCPPGTGLFAWFTLFLLFWSPAAAAPSLRARPTVFDFGTVREGMRAPVRFRITNISRENCRIESIRTFAACVQTRPPADPVLGAGESLDLEYVFESLGYGGVAVDKAIEIHYKGPDSPLILRVRGRVLSLEPFQAPIGEMTYNYFALVDLRPAPDFEKEHLLGAVHIPAASLLSWVESASDGMSPELVIYLICSDGELSDSLARTLRSRGYPQFISLVGGIREWKRKLGRKYLIAGKR